ncbi:MAG: MscS Mechanosensitive ion channel [Bacilli bacterium]|nr:MscS Mechanosensitive ion channel [Bacilli bacterium]
MNGLQSTIYQLQRQFVALIENPKFYAGIINIIILLVIARVLLVYGTKVLERVVTHRKVRLDQRRLRTIASLGSNILRYVVYFFVALIILEQIGFPLQTLLAGAGIVGIAIGFGAQNLVRDVISGFFSILEDHYAVGDEIQTGTFRGTVQDVGLRTTIIRSGTGEVHIIPNGLITQVTNYSKANSVAIVDAAIGYEENVAKVMDLMKQELTGMKGQIDHLITDPEVLGIQDLGTYQISIRILAECIPLQQGVVAREIRLRIKNLFEREKIAVPYPKHLVMQVSQEIDSENVKLPQGEEGAT